MRPRAVSSGYLAQLWIYSLNKSFTFLAIFAQEKFPIFFHYAERKFQILVVYVIVLRRKFFGNICLNVLSVYTEHKVIEISKTVKIWIKITALSHFVCVTCVVHFDHHFIKLKNVLTFELFQLSTFHFWQLRIRPAVGNRFIGSCILAN